MDASVVEAFALLGDQRKQHRVLDETRSLHSLSLELRSPARPSATEAGQEAVQDAAVRNLLVATREKEAS